MKPAVACSGAGQWGRHLIRNLADLGALAWVCDLQGHRVSVDATGAIAESLHAERS